MLDGSVHPDYAEVAALLIRQIPRNSHGGSAVCVYHGERKVVDVWGGSRDREDNPWLEDTTAPSFSTTKGVMSTLLHILVDQGLAAYDDPIAKHWPEFAANGKGNVTIRQALCHEAGLYRIDEMITHANEILDWEHMKALVAAARPVHEPGVHHGYHALTYGWLIGGIIEAVSGKPLQRVLQEELVDPLGLDGMFIGMPHNEMYRRAKLITRDGIMTPVKETDGWNDSVREWIERVFAKIGIEFSEFRSAMALNEPFDWNADATVQAVIPAANGQFTARSLARMYAMIANGGEIDGVRLLSEARVREMGESAEQEARQSGVPADALAHGLSPRVQPRRIGAFGVRPLRIRRQRRVLRPVASARGCVDREQRRRIADGRCAHAAHRSSSDQSGGSPACVREPTH